MGIQRVSAPKLLSRDGIIGGNLDGIGVAVGWLFHRVLRTSEAGMTCACSTSMQGMVASDRMSGKQVAAK